MNRGSDDMSNGQLAKAIKKESQPVMTTMDFNIRKKVYYAYAMSDPNYRSDKTSMAFNRETMASNVPIKY